MNGPRITAISVCTVVILTSAFLLAMLMYREKVSEAAQKFAGSAHSRAQ